MLLFIDYTLPIHSRFILINGMPVVIKFLFICLYIMPLGGTAGNVGGTDHLRS